MLNNEEWCEIKYNVNFNAQKDEDALIASEVI